MSNSRSTGDQRFYAPAHPQQLHFPSYNNYPANFEQDNGSTNAQQPRYNHRGRQQGGNNNNMFQNTGIRYPPPSGQFNPPGQVSAQHPLHNNWPANAPAANYPPMYSHIPLQIPNPNVISQMPHLPPGPSYVFQTPFTPHPHYPAQYLSHAVPTMSGIAVSHPSHYTPPSNAPLANSSAMMNSQQQQQVTSQSQQTQQQQQTSNTVGGQPRHIHNMTQNVYSASSVTTPVSVPHSHAQSANHIHTTTTNVAQSAQKSSKAIPIVDPKTNQQVSISKSVSSTSTNISQSTSSSTTGRPSNLDAPSPVSSTVSSEPANLGPESQEPSVPTLKQPKQSSTSSADKHTVEKDMLIQVRNATMSTTNASSAPSIVATEASAPKPTTVDTSTRDTTDLTSFIDKPLAPESSVTSVPPVELDDNSTILNITTSSDVSNNNSMSHSTDFTDLQVEDHQSRSPPVENGLSSPPTVATESIDLTEIEHPEVSVKYDFKPDKADSAKITQEKKLKYDREFLLRLQPSKLSTVRPANLPKDMPDIIMRSSDMPDRLQMKPNNFIPSYVQTTPLMKHAKNTQGAGNYQRRGNKPQTANKQHNIMVIEVRNEKIDLHKSEDAYVPRMFKPNEIDENAKNNEIERHIRSVLNKITPQNFDSCFTQLTQCDIGSVHGLQACVDIIFEKATRELSYSSVFAEICKKLQFLKVNVNSGEAEDPESARSMYVGYRSLLLKKCQNMFETPLQEQMVKRAELWDAKINQEESEEKKRYLGDEKEEAMKKVKDQFYGNIRFVGELFIKDILTANIIHKCIFDLLKADANMITESLECLCELLRTVGKKIEEDVSAKDRIDQYFSRIQKLIENTEKPLESKVKFKLIDIVEMRHRKWEQREMVSRLQEKPMTKDELQRKERIEEEKRKQMVANQPTGSSRSNRAGYSGKPPVSGAGPAQAGADTWQQVPMSSKKPQKLDTRKLVIGQAGGGSADIRLGPGRKSFGNYGMGAANTGKQDNGRPSTPTRNTGSSKNSRESSASRGASRDASPHLEAAKLPRSASSQELPARAVSSSDLPLPNDILERKCKNIFDEWLNSLCSFEETKQNFNEIAYHPNIKQFIEVNVDLLLNEGTRDLRERGSLLFYKLMFLQLLKQEDFVEGFMTFIENAEDLMVDVPYLMQYFGEIFSSLIQKENQFLNVVKELVMKLDPSLKGGRARAEVLSKTLHLASARIGHDVVGIAFRSLNIRWEDVLPSSDVESFVQDNNLEFTVKEQLTSPSPIPLEKLGVEIRELCLSSCLKESTEVTESIFSLIEKEVDKDSTEDEAFCRVITRSICSACLSKGVFDKNLFKILNPVFRRYIDSFNQEMWCLKAVVETVIQVGVTQDLLSECFLAFLDATLISEETYESWRLDENRPDIIQASEMLFKTLDSTKVHNSR